MSPQKSLLKNLWEKEWLPYAFPFALFLLFTEPSRFLPDLAPYLYICKTILIGGLLWFWRKQYGQDFSSRLSLSEILTSLACGLLVLLIWIVPDGFLYQLEQSAVFDPYSLGESQAAFYTLISIRLMGAVLVVPIMEELFWRSFIMRYLINPDFRSLPMGTFSWLSFLGVAVLFGLEHHLIGAGIIAGLLYGGLLVWQKNLKGVILAHAVTNLGLGIYVIRTGKWIFW
ncbi:MAG: CAAX prenyl protease-related protein [Proteobacteria bacterium]|nr:CAAX prenyl protease-related protein [Pseudomonadota bacterium]MBU1058174.1 CAAX prenyl protease-related protein [Pseudomonadota bacterium]